MGAYGKFITPSQIKAYAMCPKYYELMYVKKRKPERAGGLVMGEAVHNVLLDTIRQLKAVPDPSYEDYHRIFIANLGWFGRKLKPAVREFLQENYDAKGRTILDQLQISFSELGMLDVEKSYYMYNPFRLHAVPDLVLVDKALNVYVHDLKSGPAPKGGVFERDAISITASVLPVVEELRLRNQETGDNRRIHVKASAFYVGAVYSRLRELDPDAYLPKIKGYIEGIRHAVFEPNKNSCQTCSYQGTECD